MTKRSTAAIAYLAAALTVFGCADLPTIQTRGDGDDPADSGDDRGSTGGSLGDSSDLSLGGSTDDAGTGGQTASDPICGNGDLEAGELCDDGNDKGGDGCSADCTEQNPDFDCSEPGKPCKPLSICGNGVLEGDELCDTGSASSAGCTDECETVENGFVCPKPGEACVALPVCGNEVRERGEECDDGNAESGDGCLGTEDDSIAPCQVEEGFVCRVPGEDCIELVCGDGVRTFDEECDDGPDHHENGDGCDIDCKVEDGYRCGSSGCTAVCGDGVFLSGIEECEDGNRASGDGCSSACKEEPFYTCDEDTGNCTSSIECGNNLVEPGEICDPPNVDGCNPGCESFAPDVGPPAECGNSIIEIGEECDPPNVGSGCTVGCLEEDGFSCPLPGVCFALPACGDGIQQAGEECDTGTPAGPGCVSCAITDGYVCYGVEPTVCELPVCGNGIRSPDEECDDDNLADGDGCTDCLLDEGFVCPTVGEDCIAICGDGQILGDEECDDDNTDNDDGCNAACRIEPGFSCPDEGESCVPSECGNGDTEPGEGCDDGNEVAADGCGPTCQLEPTVTVGPNPVVNVTCGDGLKTSGEGCDDGNTTSGDGCSSSCALETGFICDETLELPSSVEMQITVRDFKSGPAPGGHPDFQYGWLDHYPGVAGLPCTTANQGSCGRLNLLGKPTLVVDNQSETAILNASTFSLWYADSNPTNIAGLNGTIAMLAPVAKTVTLSQVGGVNSETYVFDATSNFFPLGPAERFGAIKNDAGYCCTTNNGCNNGIPCLTSCGNPGCNDCVGGGCDNQNFNFTSELRYFFQYKGGESLSFEGDDDVWVYVNGRLAVDLGGVHASLHGRVILGDDGSPSGGDSDCSAHGVDGAPAACALTPAEAGDNTDSRFGLTVGGVYEIVLFHAERHTSASNFKLTLSGFLAPRTYCEPDCGDGEVVGYEVCDDGEGEDGNSDTIYGRCNTSCTGRTFCGDGVRQGPTDNPVGPEVCDNGRNLDTRDTGLPNQCAPGCTDPTYCGDGIVQGAFEQCDLGNANDDMAYGLDTCKENCTLGGYCGDGVQNGTETCDYRAPGATTYGPSSCGYDCQAGPRCGDGVRNGPEDCDGTPNCDSECHIEPFCGDGDTPNGLDPGDPGYEECDYGQFASEEYGGCTDMCTFGPSCGDGNPDAPYEECDEGPDNDDSAYGGCNENCGLGPRCGDGERQEAEGEACDNGFNDDAYAYDENSCAPGCEAPPACGDGDLQEAFEFCDDGDENSDTAYGGCTTQCEFGPFCGDDETNGDEECDNGLDNVAYANGPGACGYDCQLDPPYCGDGVRNGPEQCDEGTANNDGGYGGCDADCRLAERCGDRIVQKSEGEQCDDGPLGSLKCTVFCKVRNDVK